MASRLGAWVGAWLVGGWGVGGWVREFPKIQVVMASQSPPDFEAPTHKVPSPTA